ncbi:MAG TPA: helix-turn-helix domain-containing protein [Terriglobales bacterium]
MNWSKLITELLASGMTQAEIADRIGVTQSAINQVLHQGRQKRAQRGFKFEPGMKLVELHKSVVLDKAKVDSAATSDDVQPPAGTSVRKTKEARMVA